MRSPIGVLGAFYDLFVGIGSFAAGAVSDHLGYASAFILLVPGALMRGRGWWGGSLFRKRDAGSRDERECIAGDIVSFEEK